MLFSIAKSTFCLPLRKTGTTHDKPWNTSHNNLNQLHTWPAIVSCRVVKCLQFVGRTTMVEILLAPKVTLNLNKWISVPFTDNRRRNVFVPCSFCTCMYRIVPTSIQILYPACDIDDKQCRPFSQTQSNTVFHNTTKTTVCPERHIIPNDTTQRTMFVDRKWGKQRGKKEPCHPFSSFFPSQCGLFVFESGYVV